MSKKLFGKFFIFLLVVGLLFAVAPTGQAQAATYTTWVAQVPAAPTSADNVRVWINSDTADGETILVEYKIGETYTKIAGTYDTSYSGATWRADIPAQPAGTVVSYQLITRNQSNVEYAWSGFNWSYTVAAAPVLPVHNTTQGTYYSTLQAAITAASAGDTITVAADTYVELGQIVIDKNLTIVGADKATTIIKPAQNTGSTGDARGWFLVNTGVEFNLSNVTLDGAGYQIHTAIRTHGSGLINNNIIKNIYYTQYVGLGISVFEGTAVISNNTITGIERVAVHVFGVNATQTEVTNNVITGAGVGDKVQYGVEVGGGGNAKIQQNTISNFGAVAVSDGSGSAGILVTTYYAPGTQATILNNTITNNSTGVYVGYDADDTSLVQIENNTITNNDYYIVSTAAGVDGSPNWYGSATGPAAGTIDGPIVYAPWCADATCTTFAAPPTKLNMSPATAATTDTCGATTVDVMVTDVTDLVGYHLEVLFDPNLVTINSVVNGGFLDATGAFYEPTNTIDTTNGRIIWGMTQQGSAGNWNPKTGSGSLIRITFTPKVAGEVVFTIDGAFALLPTDPDAFSAPFEVTGGATFDFGSIVTNTTKSPTVSYCNLATAYAGATSGDTLRADVDFTTTSQLSLISKSITFDTNNKTITRIGATSAYDSLFYVRTAHLIITGGGTLNSTSTSGDFGAAIRMLGGSSTGAKVTLQNATLSGDYASASVVNDRVTYPTLFEMTGGFVTDGLYVQGYAELNITGGTVEGWAPIMGNGSVSGNTMITIGGSAVIDGTTGTPSLAIFHPQNGVLTINGGTIIGTNGIEMKAGDLVVTGGTIQGTGACALPTATGSGSTDTGDAILIFSRDGYGTGQTMDVTITGTPLISSTNCYALREFTLSGETSRLGVAAISGGRFTGGAAAVSFTTVSDANLDLTGGAYNTDPGATPDYVFEPLDTYLNTTDNYYYIEEVLMGRIDVLPGFNPPNLTWATDTAGTYIEFTGDIPWYPYQAVPYRSQGNRVAFMVTEPEGYDPAVATMTIGTQDPWIWADERTEDGWVDVWQKIYSVPQETLVVLKWNNVSTQTFPVRVLTGSNLLPPPEPIITSTDIQGYYLTGEAREFNVNLEMPADGANYALLIFDYKLSGVSTADITSFEYFAQDLNQWIVMGSRAYETYDNCTDNTGICGQFGWAPGGFGPVAAGFTNTSTFRINFANAFTAPLSFTVDLSGKLATTDTVWTPLTTYTGSLNVYPKPVITATFPAGPYAAGVPVTVPISITNPGGIPGPFSLVLDLPDGTVFTFNGVEYLCGDDPATTEVEVGCPPITVTLPIDPASNLVITFDEGWSGDIGMSLYDTSWDPDRELATFTKEAVVVYGNVASVTGTVSMQGRLTTAGVPVTLTGTLGFGPYTVPSVEGASGNLTFTDLVVGTYTITTNQPRYLNITADMAKVINIATDTDIAALRLRGGNAIWENDNVIDNLDLGKVTLGYTAGITSHPDADVNFDNRINIQDLALVGGNYNLTSAGAYGTWQP